MNTAAATLVGVFAGDTVTLNTAGATGAFATNAVGNNDTVQVSGLMLIPPAVEDPEQARPFFRRLRAVRDRLRDEGVEPAMLNELSMGMTHDFEVAIEEGATIVRIGTAIFGSRPVPNRV